MIRIIKSPSRRKKITGNADCPESAFIDAPVHRTIQDACAPIVDSYELPASYGTTNIILMARDPYWLYAYWDVAQPDFEEAKSKLGLDFDLAKMTLRLYDVTRVNFDGANANSFFDLDVGHSRNWYINLWKDNVTYCAEIGMKTMTGRFHPFARSNAADTPRSNMSWRREEVWMKVSGNETKPPYVNYETAAPQGRAEKPAARSAIKSPAGSGNAAETRTLAEEASPVTRSRRAKRIFLTEDDIRAYYYGLSPTLRDIILGRLRSRASAHSADSADLCLMYRNPALADILMQSPGFSRRLIAGSSEELAMPEHLRGASENLAKGASEHMLGLRGRKFFFEIATELIVYGRTEPDAMVLLGDKKVSLRQDGTFTLRFALPDGKVPLDFAAISGDKFQRREITTAVERSATRSDPPVPNEG